MDHNNCRNFDLTLINDNNHRHLAVRLAIIESNTPPVGPWCYAYDQMACLSFADRSKILATADMKPNYNAKLIDSIAVKAFSKYEWGPSNYYDSRPSNILLSAEFEKNRYSIFFAMIAVGMTVMICSISFVIARNYMKIREKQMKQEMMGGNLSQTGQLPSKKVEAISLASKKAKKLKQDIGTPV
ncbi:unnamed protein product [Onchocerca ochengi]|nr:unnamed protein product [Onchocerca ochengi]